jgi:hypothetical protein
MPSFFISYRRDDSAGHAGRLYDRLSARYGPGDVFIDRYDLAPGQDFSDVIDSNLARAEIALVVIGPRWADARDAEGRQRLALANDFVRRELLAALGAGKRVIPILVGGAAMPDQSQLPAELAALARIQAWELRDSRFDDDLNGLMAGFPAPGSGAATKVGAENLAGEWRAEVTYSWGTSVTERFIFEADGDEWFGSATFLTTMHPLEDVEPLADGLRFTTHSESTAGNESRRSTHRYRVRVEGDTLHVRMQSTGGFGDDPPSKFTARRVRGG